MTVLHLPSHFLCVGQHRWVEYAGNKNFYEVDASYIAPEWHGWIHGTTAEPPTEVRSSRAEIIAFI